MAIEFYQKVDPMLICQSIFTNRFKRFKYLKNIYSDFSLKCVFKYSGKTRGATINLEGDEVAVPEATRLRYPIKVQLITSMSTSSQPTYLLPSSIKFRMIGMDLKRIKTLFVILDEYQLRVAYPKERADWRSPGWICFYEVVFIAGFRFSFPKLFREFFAHFGISYS